MFTWLKEYLDLRLDYRRKLLELERDTKVSQIEVTKEDEVCESCRTLKMQLSIANDEKKSLLDRILNPPIVMEDEPRAVVQKPVGPTVKVWSDRKRMLEQNSKLAARVLQENSKPTNDELEKKLVNAEDN